MGAAIMEWSIHYIARSPLPRRDGYRGDPEFQWRIVLNVPSGGEIAFVASGYTLTLRAEPSVDADRASRPPLVLPH